MKKHLLCIAICMMGLGVWAQNEAPQYGLTAEDVLRWHELSEKTRASLPPTGPVVNIAEFEPMTGVLIAYPSGGFGIPNTLIVQLSELVTVKVAVSSSFQQNQARNQLQNMGANMDNIEFVVGSVDSYWTRDFGPWFVLDASNQFGVADFTYNRPSRPNDDNHMSIMASNLGIAHYDFPIVHTGGNYMSDGYGTAASTDLVLQENTSLTEAQILQYCSDYLGIDNYHLTIDPQGDYIAHIDCWGKFLGVNKILIAQLPQGASHYQDYENVAAYFANATTPWGDKYQVFRVFEPGSSVSNARTPYTNSLILNDHVFVPVTGTSYDDDAIAVYQAAMPGYTIVPVMEKSSAQWLNTDALHCRTHELADLQMLRFHHFPTLGAQPFDTTFAIATELKVLSGQSVVEDSVRIYYRTIHEGETTSWSSTAMSYAGGEQWSGTITGITDTCEVQYYLFAKDQSGRREFYPYIGSPDPFVFTVAPNPGTSSDTTGTTDPTDPTDTTFVAAYAAPDFTVAPNPARSSFEISASGICEIAIYNTLGQQMLRREVQGESLIVNCSQWASGTYFVHAETRDGSLLRKKIIVR